MVFDSLRKDLRDGDALLHGLRLTSAHDGDIEIDIALLLHDAGLAVIEVKGGRVSFHDGEWISQSAGATHHIDPVTQVRKNMYALRDFLTGSKAWSRGPLRDVWMLALPYTDVREDLSSEAPRERVIDQNDVDHAMRQVRYLLNDAADVRPISSSGWVDAALDILLGRGEPLRDVIADALERADQVERLTREQGRILDLLAGNPRIEVTGSAGTGKTWLAFEQARRWSSAGMRVALLSFGRGLAETLKAQTAALKYNKRPAFVGTFHQLGVVWNVVPEQGAPSQWWDSEAPMLMQKAAESLPDGHKFDALVVDEAQDFADSWWQPLLCALRDPATARIATFRDDSQAVFGRRGRPDLDFAKAQLSQNLRNTKQIAEAFQPLTPHKIEVQGGPGPEVQYIDCSPDDVIGVASDCAAQLLDEGWAAQDVALLTTYHRHPVHAEQQAEGQEAYWSNLWIGDDIFYCTVAGFKGLERPAVVVAVDGFRPGQDPNEVLYVAMSRARDKLIVVGNVSR